MHDAIIVGGGHNGLVCAAYLARAGFRPLVLERRDVIGGAAVTEEPWPGYRVSTLAYVTSLLLPKVVRDLALERHGYHVWEVEPDYFVPFPDGESITVWADPAKTAKELKRYSSHDAEAYPAFDEFLSAMALTLRRILTMTPPRVGSLKPGDLWRQLQTALRFRGLGVEGVGSLTKLMGRSVKDLLDEYFEAEVVKTAFVSQGIIGAYCGPHSPGTAYVMLHHWMGEVHGNLGSWGVVRGGMGAISSAIAEAALDHGAEIHTSAEVGRILTKDGRAVGVALADGTELRAPVVVSNLHPKTTYLGLLDLLTSPTTFAAPPKRS